MKVLLILCLTFFLGTVSYAQDGKMSTEQCINILIALKSLSCAGQQLGSACSPDAKQYKLGAARMQIALDISALQSTADAAQIAQSGFVRELPALPAADAAHPSDPVRQDAMTAQNKAAESNLRKIMETPCTVRPAPIDIKDLNVGDEPDHNAIPPNVLAGLRPIISGLQ